MTSLRPAAPRSRSYVRTREQGHDLLYPENNDHRTRSTSRNPKQSSSDNLLPAQNKSHRGRSTSKIPKQYSSDSPRHYMPNESRLRKPPQSPEIEDAGVGDDGVKMRGMPDQQPMIIDIASESGSSDESPGILTPDESSTDTQNDQPRAPSSTTEGRHIHKVQKSSKRPEVLKSIPGEVEKQRGRREIPKLDTEFARNVSSGGQAPRLERERSPYAHTPRDAQTQKSRFSGEYLMSPQTMSPQIQRPERFDLQSPQVNKPSNGDHSRPSRPSLKSRHTSGSGSDNAEEIHNQPRRPPIDRRASAMSQLNSPTSSRRPSSYGQWSSDESDRDITSRRVRSGNMPAQVKTNPMAPSLDSQGSRDQRHPYSPPFSPDYVRTTPVNRESLFNGAALQNISTLLEAHHTDDRRASPRGSPAASPNMSPYSSPPGTPPLSNHSRVNPIANLKHDSPRARPSSPLTSGPSSPKAPTPTFTSHIRDQEPNPRRPPPRSRATSPMPSSRFHEKESMVAPKIDVRSPSPLPPKHGRTSSYEAHEPHSPTYTRHASYASLDVPGSSPTRTNRPTVRQRSHSNAEVGRPVLHEETRYPKSPTTKYTPQAYLPVSSDRITRGSNLDPNASSSELKLRLAPESTGSRHRSRSSVHEPDRHSHRSRSSAPRPDQSYHRSKSSVSAAEIVQSPKTPAPSSQLPVSHQSNPTNLPVCTRPDPVLGYDDWYTLDQYPTFAICPDCRFDIFGSGYDHYFQRNRELSRKKTLCVINDPWIRLACLLTFNKRGNKVKMLEDLAQTAEEERPCPQGAPAEKRDWFHLNDAETGLEFSDFQICGHCVNSLEGVFRRFRDTFHESRDLKDEPRVCAFRSDENRFAKYIDRLVAMDDELHRSQQPPDMTDFIWEVKKMTVISPCAGDQVLWGQDWHIHPELPELTVCEDCYLKAVRPAIKSRSREARKISGQSHEVKDGVSCKLFSPRMKQIFFHACKAEDHDELRKAVKKRNDLQQDLIKAQADVQRYPRDRELQSELDELAEKWAKLAKRHD